jgi:hypothetical protein
MDVLLYKLFLEIYRTGDADNVDKSSITVTMKLVEGILFRASVWNEQSERGPLVYEMLLQGRF